MSSRWYSSRHQKDDIELCLRLLRSDGFKITSRDVSSTGLPFAIFAKKREHFAIRIIDPSATIETDFWKRLAGMVETPCLAFNSKLSNLITDSLVSMCQKHGVPLCPVTPTKIKFVEPTLSTPAIYAEIIHIEAEKLRQQLDACEPGRKDWRDYEDICEEAFRILFVPPLDQPRVQSTTPFEIRRRDFIFPNYATSGFWRGIVFRRYKGEFVLLESKNLKDPISKEEFQQGLEYLDRDGLGMFGIVLSRKPISERVKLIQSLAWSRNGKMLVVLSDRDLKEMLRLYDGGGQPTKVILRAIETVRIGVN